MTITYHAFDHVTGSYIDPEGGLDRSCPVPYPGAQSALNAIMAMLRRQVGRVGTVPDVEIFTLIDGRKQHI